MKPLNIDSSHVAVNKAHFKEARYQPEKVLEAQRNLWLVLGVNGASQKTAPENFLIIGEPFEDDDKTICSKVFNAELLQPYKEPCLTTLNSSDTCSNVKKLSSGAVVWKHVGDDDVAVREWYACIGAEAKDGRVLFNLHYKDAWEALFHEPVHEAAPSGGVGTKPKWTYEGYCEIFAKQLAARMGHTNYNIESGPYGAEAREVQKLIDFTSETYVARAYFLNDEWAYGLLAPLWYKRVAGHDLSVDISRYIPTDLTQVPGHIEDLIKKVNRNPKPEWYKRWVRIFGRRDPMPPLTTTIGGPRLGFPKPGPLPKQEGTNMPLPPQGGKQTTEQETVDLTLSRYARFAWAADR